MKCYGIVSSVLVAILVLGLKCILFYGYFVHSWPMSVRGAREHTTVYGLWSKELDLMTRLA